eukprot:5744604-Pleurochrysis_carterae.AAC.1
MITATAMTRYACGKRVLGPHYPSCLVGIDRCLVVCLLDIDASSGHSDHAGSFENARLSRRERDADRC